MPTFAAMALDRLLEPGGTKSVENSVPDSNPVPKQYPLPKTKSVPNSNLERRNSTTVEWKVKRPQISPALYATPEPTPLPDSPSSFPPSPYIINHKRRGPRLLKSFSEDDVGTRPKASDEVKVKGNVNDAESNNFATSSNGHSVTFTISDSADGEQVKSVLNSPTTKDKLANGVHSGASIEGKHKNGVHHGELRSNNGDFESSDKRNGLAIEESVMQTPILNLERENECEDFFDPQESMSYTSNTDVENISGAESSARLVAATPTGEFFDAWEELSSESGAQPCLCDVDAELREMRLSVLMEIEKRKQAEEALNGIQNHWERTREQLALVGLTLPACPSTIAEGEQLPDTDPAEELCHQVYIARFVSDAIGRGILKAEMEVEMQAQIEAKDFEIARLLDRLQYYEAVNREMSQRNQESVEMARRNRQRRKRRQRWVWGTVASAITLGTAALAWSYLPSAKGSSAHRSLDHDHDDSAR